jgi:hypothetical protein
MSLKLPKGARTALFFHGDTGRNLAASSHPNYLTQYPASDTGQDTRAIDTGTADNWVQGVEADKHYVSGDVFDLYVYLDTGSSNHWERRGIITKA